MARRRADGTCGAAARSRPAEARLLGTCSEVRRGLVAEGGRVEQMAWERWSATHAVGAAALERAR